MDHPRRAARDPLKGAMRVARQSRFHRILGGARRSGESSDALRVALWRLEGPGFSAYCRAVRTLAGGSCGWLLRQGLMSSPPRRV